MNKPVIGIHGNCIATCLVDMFSSMPSVTQHFEVAGATFARPPPSKEALSRCVLLISQDRLRGIPLPVPQMTELVPSDRALLLIPNVTFSSLWPLTCVDPRDAREPEHPLGRYPRAYSDRIALEILGRVSDPAARRAAYLSVDLHSRMDLARYHEIQTEHMVHMERNCHVQVAAHILSSFRRQRLFFAAHHPTPALMLYVATQVFAHPIFAPFRRASVSSLISEASAYLETARPFHGEEVPVNPQVAAFFELEWCPPDLVYTMDGRGFTFGEWLDYYMRDPLPAA